MRALIATILSLFLMFNFGAPAFAGVTPVTFKTRIESNSYDGKGAFSCIRLGNGVYYLSLLLAVPNDYMLDPLKKVTASAWVIPSRGRGYSVDLDGGFVSQLSTMDIYTRIERLAGYPEPDRAVMFGFDPTNVVHLLLPSGAHRLYAMGINGQALEGDIVAFCPFGAPKEELEKILEVDMQPARDREKVQRILRMLMPPAPFIPLVL
ncbi:hypothetical protein [Pantanalinema sp. GBBB05]|uniref:hypothetical protein n=1 Tax=Pantanalinema sp. GBBB05 TaxID=2604139 RepID=UPI001D9E8094|nr:hypothetical protein [Pantanalinema sp. GBBB05]